MNKDYRIGFGFDVHELVENRKCILGGVEIESALAPLGHSDADVLSHAIADAILGACALPDIGYYFPNTSKDCENMDSQNIIKRAIIEIEKKGFVLVNIDSTLISETPKISPHLSRMKEALSKTTGLSVDDIGIKATTNEKLGFIGRKEGIAAHAVCMIKPK